MSATATVSSKYQVSIPKEVRDRMGLRPGQKVAFIEEIAGMGRGTNSEGYRDRTDRF
jgi:AbrB family looped-hinge helix DNA binding protein